MYVCLYVCMFVCMYVCMYIFICDIMMKGQLAGAFLWIQIYKQTIN